MKSKRNIRSVIRKVALAASLCCLAVSVVFLVAGGLSGRGRVVYGLLAFTASVNSLSLVLQIRNDKG